MNIDNQIWWSSAIALLGFIISGIGLYSYRNLVNKKGKINTINASQEINKLSKESKKASKIISIEIEEIRKSIEIKKSLKISAFEEIAKNVNGLINTLLTMYKKSVPEEPPTELLVFFESGYATKSWEYLDIDSNPNIIRIQNFSQTISNGFKYFIDNSEIVLNRYRNVIDADILRIIHQLTHSDEFKYLQNLHTIRKSGIINKPPILKAHSPYLTENQIQDIITLIKWCAEKEKEYESQGIKVKFNKTYATFKDSYSKENLQNTVNDDVLKLKDSFPKIKMN